MREVGRMELRELVERAGWKVLKEEEGTLVFRTEEFKHEVEEADHAGWGRICEIGTILSFGPLCVGTDVVNVANCILVPMFRLERHPKDADMVRLVSWWPRPGSPDEFREFVEIHERVLVRLGMFIAGKGVPMNADMLAREIFGGPSEN